MILYVRDLLYKRMQVNSKKYITKRKWWDYYNDELKQPDPIETLTDHIIKNDVVPVVRCKDCKHYKKINYDDISQNTCEITTKRQQPYDYCSYGERKI